LYRVLTEPKIPLSAMVSNIWSGKENYWWYRSYAYDSKRSASIYC